MKLPRRLGHRLVWESELPYNPHIQSANRNFLGEGWLINRWRLPQVAEIPVTLGSPLLQSSVLSLPLRRSRSTCPNWWYHQAVVIYTNARPTLPRLIFPSSPLLTSPSTLHQSLLAKDSPHHPPLCSLIHRLPTPTPTKITPLPVPPLRPRLRQRLRPRPRPRPCPRWHNAFDMFLLLRRLRSKANQAWLATLGGTPCVSTLTAGTGACLSSHLTERPRTIRE